DGVTRYLVVPVINLEYELNPKLPTPSILSGKDPSLATIEDSGGTKLQQLDCTNPTHKEKTVNCEDKLSSKFVCSNTFDALMINSDRELHELSTPILLVSNPETPRIIKEPQAAMLNKANPMVKSPMATINTSNHDVPNSPSLQSLGKQISGQKSISIRNDKIWSKLSSQAHIFVPSSKENSSMTVTIDNNSKKILTITTKVAGKSVRLLHHQIPLTGMVKRPGLDNIIGVLGFVQLMVQGEEVSGGI
ncbi:hypothetical protein KY289_022101, partial [Solanum tuberosum]